MLPSLGAVSACESNLRRSRCLPRSMYISHLRLHRPHIWVNQAACGVSTSYDALVELFERVGNFLKRLHIYTEIPFTPAITDIIVRIMVEVLSVLALATKEIKQGRFSEYIFSPNVFISGHAVGKFVKKLLGESKIEAVLWRLAQPTNEEARMATTLILHGVMGGT
jgi:hypothetical protein